MSDLHSLSAAELIRRYRRRELSPVEVAKDALARIERFNPVINAFVLVDREAALAAAAASEARWKDGAPLGLVDGVPATVKDNIWAKGWPSRRGSRTSDPGPISADAPAVARLREEGAVILGKTTLPEFGWIGVCHSPLTGVTRNPWKLDRTTGGSSGGAAAAALLNLGWLHLGTDGAGSIRIPAAFTGVFGIKPSYGRVPAYPASPFGVLAHTGPLTRTVGDAALMLSVIAQPDPRDMTAWNTPAPDFRIGLDEGVAGLRIAWSPRLRHVTTLDPQVEKAAAAAAQVFADLGAIVETADPDLPDTKQQIKAFWGAISSVVVDGIPPDRRDQLDQDFRRLAEDARRYSLADYVGAYHGRAELAETMRRFHERYDLLLTPQMPIGALEAGRVTPADGSFGDEWINWSPYTYPFNLTQQPAIVVGCGFSDDGLPIAMQLVAPHYREDLCLRAAAAYQQATDWHRRRPPL